MYNFPAGKLARDKRLESLYDPRWVEAMVTLIKSRKAYKKGTDWFRWHDSGDIMSVEHLGQIVKVCLATPDVHHWLPTKEHKIVSDYLSSEGSIPENLCVRISHPMIDYETASVNHAAYRLSQMSGRSIVVSAVHTEYAGYGIACPAPSQNGECRDCRKCWDTQEYCVSYLSH